MAKALTAPPVIQVIDAMERIFRSGVSPHLTNAAAWASGACPAGHWILQQGTTLYRTDEPESMARPAVVIGCTADVRRWMDHLPDVWEVPAFVDVHYSRRFEPAEAEALMQQLESVFTHGLTPEGEAFIPAADYIGFAPADPAPGLHVQHIHEVLSSPFQGKDQASVLKLEFTLRCFAYVAD